MRLSGFPPEEAPESYVGSPQGGLFGGIPGPRGPQGPQGDGIQVNAIVEDYASLPATLGLDEAGYVAFNQADGLFYIWSGTAWPADGIGAAIAGPTGPQGVQGVTGAEGPAGPEGPTGPPGETGPEGPIGLTGDTGAQGIPGTAGSYNDLSDVPTTFPPAIGSTSTTAVAGNDARLADTRTPTDASVTTAKIVDANVTMAKLGTGKVTGSVNGTETSLVVWTGTEAQYTAIVSKDPNTVYLRT